MTTAEPALSIVGRLGRAQIEQTLRRAARMMGRSRPDSLALSDIGYPDTTTALEAASLLHAQAPGVLAAHCYRTYLFGAAWELGTDSTGMPNCCSSRRCSTISASPTSWVVRVRSNNEERRRRSPGSPLEAGLTTAPRSSRPRSECTWMLAVPAGNDPKWHCCTSVQRLTSPVCDWKTSTQTPSKASSTHTHAQASSNSSATRSGPRHAPIQPLLPPAYVAGANSPGA